MVQDRSMASEDKIECKVHGLRPATFVCQHIVAGLKARECVGFIWATEDPDDPHPDAWCRACNVRVRANGGEWVGDAEANLKAQILCGDCYDFAKKFHLVGNPLS